MAEIARLQAMPRLSATTFGVAAAAALFIGIAGSACRAFGRCCRIALRRAARARSFDAAERAMMRDRRLLLLVLLTFVAA
jgi:hypothetical protein